MVADKVFRRLLHSEVRNPQHHLSHDVSLGEPFVCARGFGERELGRDRNLKPRRCYRA